MKVKELKNILSRFNKVVTNKSLPILGDLLISKGYITASNEEVTKRIKVDIAGEFLVNYKDLKKLISKLPADGEVIITDEDSICKVNYKTNVFTLHSTNAVYEFPELPMLRNVEECTVSEQQMKVINKINKLIVLDNINNQLDNMHFTPVHIVAASSYIVWTENFTTPKGFSLRKDSISTLDIVDYTVSIGDSSVCFVTNDSETYIKRYNSVPNYQPILDKTYTYVGKVNRNDLIESLSLINDPKAYNNLVTLVFDDNLTLQSENFTAVLQSDGKDYIFKISIDILLNMLNQFDEEVLEFKIEGYLLSINGKIITLIQ